MRLDEKYAQIQDDMEGLMKVGKDATIAFFGKGMAGFLGYLGVIIFARVLGPFWMGIYLLCDALAMNFSLFSRGGFQTSLLRFVSIYNNKACYGKLKKTIDFSMVVSFFLSVVASLLLFFVSGWLAVTVFKNEQLLLPLRFAIISIPFITVVFIAISIFQGLREMGRAVMIDNAQAFSLIVFFFILAFLLKSAIWGAIGAYIASFIFSACVGLILIIKKIISVNREAVAAETCIIDKKEIILYTIPFFLIQALVFTFNKIDVFIVGCLRQSSDVAFYVVALTMASFISFPLIVVNAIFSPTIASYYHEKKMRDLSFLFKSVTRWIITLSFPLFLFMALFGREILLIFGKDYSKGVLLLAILGFGQLVNAATGSVGYMLAMTARQKFLLYNALIGRSLGAAITIFLIPRIGLVGAAMGAAFAFVFVNIANLLFVLKAMKIHPFSAKYLKPFLCGILSFLLMYVLYPYLPAGDFMRLSAGTSFFVVYTAILYLLKIEKEDRVVLRRIKRTFLKKVFRVEAK